MSALWLKVDKTLRYHGFGVLRALRGLIWDLLRAGARRPIFVIGCSRAGTTLVYKTLSESRELGSLQRETHDFWSALHPLAQRGWSSHALDASHATQSVRQHVARHFYSHTGRRRWVDKNNQNGLCVPYLQALFPDATFVFVKRNPGDNLNSLIEGWMRPDEFATWSEQLPSSIAVDGAFRQWCFFLPQGWQAFATASLEEVCAFQYRTLNEAVLDARALIAPERWVEIAYEALLEDPVTSFRAAFEACGLEFDRALEAHCQGILGRPYNAFSPVRVDKWQEGPHRARIERVLPGLQGVAAHLGYAGIQRC